MILIPVTIDSLSRVCVCVHTCACVDDIILQVFISTRPFKFNPACEVGHIVPRSSLSAVSLLEEFCCIAMSFLVYSAADGY